MAAGTLKMWNADRGFGFIKANNGGPDTFLHINEKAAGIDPDRIKVGDRLTSKPSAHGTAGRRPAMCEWRDIRLVEIGLKAKSRKAYHAA